MVDLERTKKFLYTKGTIACNQRVSSMKNYVCIIVSVLGSALPLTVLAIPTPVFDPIAQVFYFTAQSKIEDKSKYNCALLATGVTNTSIVPLMSPEVVSEVVSKKTSAPNPLYGALITHLALLNHWLVIVTEQNPATVYIVHKFNSAENISMLQVPYIPDAQQALQTTGIVAIAAADAIQDNTSQNALELDARNNTNKHQQETILPTKAVFAAVKKHDGNFGQKGSGIAFIQLKAYKDPNSDKDKQATNGDTQTVYYIPEVCHVAPLDTTSSYVYMGQPLSQMNDYATLHWCSSLKMLYIGLRVCADYTQQSGVRGLVRGQVQNNKLQLKTIAPDHAFSARGNIIGRAQTHDIHTGSVMVHAITSMRTSTDLDYLILVGGNGDIQSTQSLVCALPLVRNPGSEAHGALANVQADPQVTFNAKTQVFESRAFVQPACAPEHMPIVHDSSVLVGGGAAPAPIIDMHVYGDTVFIAVKHTNNKQVGGIFYSQAIFDAQGRIANWSLWQRAGAVGDIRGFALDGRSGMFIVLESSANTIFGNIRRTFVKRLAISNYIKEQFPHEQGGIQGVVEWPIDTPGFTRYYGKRLSVLALSGYNKLVLMQIGADNNQLFGPREYTYESATYTSHNGSLNSFKPGYSALALSGGDLEHIGHIVTAAIVPSENTHNGYIVVGGSDGLAVLSSPEGAGFNIHEGLQSGFAGLYPELTFKKISNIKNIRKLIVSKHYLYIVTDEQVARMVLDPCTVQHTTNHKYVVVARADQLVGAASGTAISDALIEDGFGILATSAGLYYTNPEQCLESVTSAQDAGWRVAHNATDPITRFFAISGRYGFTRKGQVHALSGIVSQGIARVYRLFIDREDKHPVCLVPDVFMKNAAPFFLRPHGYRNYYNTDGAITLCSRSRYNNESSLIELFSPDIKGGMRNSQVSSLLINFDIEHSSEIGPLLRLQTNGGWLIAGDFGLRGSE